MNVFRAHTLRLWLVLLMSAIFFPVSSLGDAENQGSIENPYSVPKTMSPVKIDGILDEEAWAHSRVLELNYEIRPRENVPPPVRTEVLLTYDRFYFYIGFRCYDPEPSQIRAHFRDRDSLGGDDWVAVEIDTYNDSRRAFTLFSTPLGVQVDGISDTAGIKDYNWDMIYESAGKIFDWGYGVEMAIPFSSLRFQRTKEGQIWGINIVRGYPRNVMYQIWSQSYDRGNTCRVCQYTKIQGFEGVTPGNNIEVNPTITGVRTDERDDFPEGGFTTRDKKSEIGLTSRWGITPNLILSGVVNPDFSQVEADAAQLDINQPFALFYPEKRPFFNEGLDFFRTFMDVVYTRTLRDPEWGVKLSGKEGANAIGAYVVKDDITNLIFPGSQYSRSNSVIKPNTAAVFRYSRDIWNNSTIGVLFTNRNGESYYNRVYGIDGNLRFSQQDEITFQFLGSSTKYDDPTAKDFNQPEGLFSDRSITALFTHKTRYHQLQFMYLDYGTGFRADLGFMPQVGLRRFQALSSYNWVPKQSGSWWSRFTLFNSAQYTSDSDGLMLDKVLVNSFTYSGFLQSAVTLGNTITRQHYDGVEFGLLRFDINASINPTGAVWFDLRSSFGDSIDFVNTRKGSRILLAPSLIYNLGTHLRINLSHTFERMNAARHRLYTANISQASIIYHLNAKIFFRSILQYYDYDYNISNYLEPIQPQFRQFFSQVLFSYKINPRTVLFLGYSDNYFGGYEFGLTKKDFTFFTKIGYAWVL